MKDLKLDRTSFWSGTHEELEKRNKCHNQSMTHQERLRASWILTLRAYGYDPQNPPRLDRTIFSMGKNSE